MNNNTPHKPRKSRHAKRHAAEQTEPFGFDELETVSYTHLTLPTIYSV